MLVHKKCGKQIFFRAKNIMFLGLTLKTIGKAVQMGSAEVVMLENGQVRVPEKSNISYEPFCVSCDKVVSINDVGFFTSEGTLAELDNVIFTRYTGILTREELSAYISRGIVPENVETYRFFPHLLKMLKGE